MKSLVSIIIISYNHKAFLPESIASVYGQSYNNIEVVVIDDCSTDGSADVIIELNQHYPFKYIQNKENIGLNDTIMRALNVTQGDYVSLFSADDYITPNKIEEQLTLLVNSGKDGVYGTGYMLEDTKETFILIDKVFNTNDRHKILDYLYQYDWNAPLLQSALLKRNVFFELAPLRKIYKSDDWAFIIKAYELFDIMYIDKPYFYYRIHNNNTHKNYWFTFPMRVELAAKLVPDAYRLKALSNIFFSQGQNLMKDGKVIIASRLYLSSIMLHFSFKRIYLSALTYAYFLKKKLFK
jgi:glycosyltransferase involved in cell wall biosynthesis